jgi:hypothetical protein
VGTELEARTRLAAAIERAIDESEASLARWGVDDCVLWCANILRDGIDLDPVPSIRGRYRSQRGAYRVIGKQGLAAGMRYRARKFGWRRIEPRNALIGDLGVFKDELTGTQSCVLKYRDRFWIARAPHGVAILPDSRVVLAWGVA